jgi:hypothetical protein
MYVGNHMFLEAPRTGEVVQMADLRNPYWSSQFAGARRVVPLSAGGLSQAATAPAAGTPAAPAAGTPAAPAGVTPAVDPATTPAAAGAPAAGAAPVPTPGAPDPNAAGVSASGTAQFQAVGGHEPHHHRLNTVKFMPAVQPPPTSPLDPTTAQPGQPVAGQPVVDQIQGQPGTTTPAGAPTTGVGAGEQALSQAPVPAGSVISVSSSMLTSGQQTFVAHLSSLTGLNTRVIGGWVCVGRGVGQRGAGSRGGVELQLAEHRVLRQRDRRHRARHPVLKSGERGRADRQVPQG